MRQVGFFVLMFGVIGLLAAMSMDVSVSTGSGSRVNNIGLIADRQNYTLIAGLVSLGGLLMMAFGGKQSSAPVGLAKDTRPCPKCAELIKNAAIKCKHCGSDVEAIVVVPAEIPQRAYGWVASIPCAADDERDQTMAAISGLQFPVVSMPQGAVGAGPFATIKEAEAAANLLREKCSLSGDVVFKDPTYGA